MLLCCRPNGRVLALRYAVVRNDRARLADEPEAECVAQAVDLETQNCLASLPLPQMAAWLKANGYVWRTGSSGVWEKAA